VWIITALQCISPEVNVKGVKKCHISNAMNETDDDVLRNGSDHEDGDSNTDW